MIVPHYDENNNVIDVNSFETTEQHDAEEHIKPNDIVLELGARYGTVSTVINKILNNKKNHVVIEPDPNVLNSLKKNRANHQCEFEIFTGVITNKNKIKVNQNGYGTYVSETDGIDENTIETITYKNFCKKYNLKFNVLVVDCEGCFCDVLDSIGDDITNFDKILIELDQENLCNYDNIDKKLSKHFLKIKPGFHSIYVNKKLSENFSVKSSYTNNKCCNKFWLLVFTLFILLILCCFMITNIKVTTIL